MPKFKNDGRLALYWTVIARARRSTANVIYHQSSRRPIHRTPWRSCNAKEQTVIYIIEVGTGVGSRAVLQIVWESLVDHRGGRTLDGLVCSRVGVGCVASL